MPWGDAQTITQVTPVSDGAWSDIETVGLNPRESVVFQMSVDNLSGTVTNAIQFRVLNSNDDGTTWDDHAIWAMSVTPTAVTAEEISFMISGYPHIKLQARSAGATDDYTVNGTYKLDGVSA